MGISFVFLASIVLDKYPQTNSYMIVSVSVTSIIQNMATLGKNIPVNFFLCPISLFAKRTRFLPPLDFSQLLFKFTERY